MKNEAVGYKQHMGAGLRLFERRQDLRDLRIKNQREEEEDERGRERIRFDDREWNKIIK